MTILVTGAAGFIGAAVSHALLANKACVIGIDNLNDYYDPQLKKSRLAHLTSQENFYFYTADIKDTTAINALFNKHKPRYVINLAAQAGVRYSITNPMAYIDSNLVGFSVILEACRHYGVKHLIYASSSSVYGNTTEQPFSTEQPTDHPLSFYAATKKSNELLAYSYSHLYNLPVTGLRYFTVYGPWGRPDMAPIKFTQSILAKKAIQIFNHGNHQRDFTYIDDIVAGTLSLLDKPANNQTPPYQLFNIGCGRPMDLMYFINLLEQTLGVTAIKEYLPKQAGDVDATWANISALQQLTGYTPKVNLEEGVNHLVEWYLKHYPS